MIAFSDSTALGLYVTKILESYLTSLMVKNDKHNFLNALSLFSKIILQEGIQSAYNTLLHGKI
jgi:hypothetical protein